MKDNAKQSRKRGIGSVPVYSQEVDSVIKKITISETKAEAHKTRASVICTAEDETVRRWLILAVADFRHVSTDRFGAIILDANAEAVEARLRDVLPLMSLSAAKVAVFPPLSAEEGEGDDVILVVSGRGVAEDLCGHFLWFQVPFRYDAGEPRSFRVSLEFSGGLIEVLKRFKAVEAARLKGASAKAD